MNRQKHFARALFFVFLLACLLTGLVGVVRVPVNAAPQRQVATNIVISEFRTRGAGGTGDEFVEIYNPTTIPISIVGWQLRVLTAGGGEATRATIPGGVILASGQHYLIANSSGYNGAVIPADQTYATGVVDAGGVAIFDNIGNRIDSVGTTFPSIYTEGTELSPLTQNLDQSYERQLDISGACIDSNNNASDFYLRSPSDPQNSSSPIVTCGNPTETPSPTLSPTATNTSTATSTPSSTPTSVSVRTLLINEVAWAGTDASSGDEWIELYNPGTSAVNLAGWVLKTDDGSPTISLSGTIPAGGYFLLERSNDSTVSDIIADLIYTGELNNSNEVLRLSDPSGFVVDTANSNGGMWPAGNSSTFGSMERRGTVADSDTAWITNTGVVANGLDANGNPLKGTPKQSNWALTVTATPSQTPTVTRTSTLTRTPTRTPTPLPPPPLIAINEFVPRPGHDWNNDGVIDVGDEYIEIINHGVIEVNLSGYRLDDEANIGSSPFTLPSFTLRPGERIVFYGSQTRLLLSDGGDGVRLLRPNGQLMDAYNYFIVEFPDQSFCRLPDDGGLDDWNKNCFPTPGLRNSLSGSILRPPTQNDTDAPLCPIADTLPEVFAIAECSPFGQNIWNRYYWDEFGWYDEMVLPNAGGRWEVFAD